MILEGFEIEHWSCIRKVAVNDLPSTGVVVLHGPNQTGKSSIVRALRACLMDYPSTSSAAALKTSFPRGGSGEKPVVSVTFRTNGASYRVTKNFGTSKSELAKRQPDGSWKIEANTAAEVHRLTCELVGGDDSAKGLHQLLWLSQAQFDLPNAKTFDSDVQQRLRAILGVLQTPLDDKFLQRVKTRWNNWHAGDRKPGKEPALKKGCKLAENLQRLQERRGELAASEAKFQEAEAFIRRIGELEFRRIDLSGQLDLQRAEQKKCAEAFDRSRERIAAWRLASAQYDAAEKDYRASLKEQDDRRRVALRVAEVERELVPTQEKVETATRHVAAADAERDRLQKERSGLQERRRETDDRATRVSSRLAVLTLQERLQSARRDFARASAIEEEIASLEAQSAEHPAPDDKMLSVLKANRRSAEQHRADQKAASISLRLVPESNALAAEISIDGKALSSADVNASPLDVRRTAELHFPGWGRVEISRGSAHMGLDDIERQLKACDDEFANAIAAFGVSAIDPGALDLLIARAAESRQRTSEIARKKSDLKELAPKGAAPLQAIVVECETKLTNASQIPASSVPLPTERHELEALATTLTRTLQAEDSSLQSLESEIKKAETALKSARDQESATKETLAGFNASLKSRREELSRLPSENEIETRVEGAKETLEAAQQRLKQSELSDDEKSFEAQLTAIEEAAAALERQIRDNEATYNTIKGQLTAVEGLHANRAALAARVDELTRLTDREQLEREAVDRLYQLFDECRDKQLGALLEPIHERVLGWMRVLGVGNYNEMKFTDAFLPDKLVRQGDGAEFSIQDESTGAQEQLGMLVRLALGSMLSSVENPALAILDDPLTHSDVGRLAKMRGILRRASEGDSGSNPPAGPLQIVVLTCHPEWFRDERARVIDLQESNVLQRAY